MTPDSTQQKNRAKAAVDMHRWEVAVDESSRLLQLSPDDLDGHGWLAQALYSLQKFKEADVALTRAIGIDPEDAWFHRIRALVRRGENRLPEALESIDESLRLFPSEANALYVRSLILEDMGKMPEARKEAERAIEQNPSSSTFLGQLASLWLTEDPSTAEGYYRKALKIDPNNAAHLNNLGVALKKQKRIDEAMLAFRSALVLDPMLKVARSNVKDSVHEFLTPKPIAWIAAVLIVIKLAVFVPLALVILVPVAAVAFYVAREFQHQSKVRRLSKIDPQLYTLYKKLMEHS